MAISTMTDDQVKEEARRIVEQGPSLTAVSCQPTFPRYYAVPAHLFESLVDLAQRPHD